MKRSSRIVLCAALWTVCALMTVCALTVKGRGFLDVSNIVRSFFFAAGTVFGVSAFAVTKKLK